MSERERPRRTLSPPVLRWEDRTAWPMFALSLLFFAGWVWSLADTKLDGRQQSLLLGAIGVLWAVFIADFLVRLSICGSPREFFRTRWFEAVSLVIVYLRPFVILAYLWRLPWFRLRPSRQRVRRRTIAVGLMMGGLVVLGVTSATVISALTDQMQRVGQRLEDDRAAAIGRGMASASAPTPDRADADAAGGPESVPS